MLFVFSARFPHSFLYIFVSMIFQLLAIIYLIDNIIEFNRYYKYLLLYLFKELYGVVIGEEVFGFRNSNNLFS